MRIWDIVPRHLCRQHLLGEHRELHAIWSILTKDKQGYRNHPETKRWRGKLAALFLRHEKLIAEMAKRNYRHYSLLDKRKATGSKNQSAFINTPKQQREILRKKGCECQI